MARSNEIMKKTKVATVKRDRRASERIAKSPRTMKETQDVAQKINTGCLWGGD